MSVEPYIFFEGRAEEALEFYKSALDAEVEMMMRYSEAPDEEARRNAPADGDKIMHMSFRVAGTTILGSDGYAKGNPEFKGFGLALSTADEKQADAFFSALSQGGTAVMPMQKTFFSPRFGMVTDKFGVRWMIMVPRS